VWLDRRRSARHRRVQIRPAYARRHEHLRRKK
jgi:hypothetical protein